MAHRAPGGAWAADISPVRALLLPGSAVTVIPDAAKAAADAAAESSARTRTQWRVRVVTQTPWASR